MSMFTLSISCLTTSNLLWFMDVTFQVPMQYCSLQHRTLLSPPDASTAGHCFCFGSASSFFLVLFLSCSLVAYWTRTDLGGSSFSVISFCLFKMLFLFVSYTSMKLKNGTNILNYYKYIFESIRSLYSGNTSLLTRHVSLCTQGTRVSWPTTSVWGFQWVSVTNMHIYGDYMNFVPLI